VTAENVKLTQETFAAYNRGGTEANPRDLAPLIALLDAQVEIHTRVAGLGEVTIYRGHDGVRSWLAELDETWEELRIEIEALFDLGDRTLTFYVLRGRGRQSGVETSIWFASVATVRDGLIVSYKVYRDKTEALAELGLGEDELEPIAP
jgi:ketosteroid isomerase-like protein